MPSYHYWPARHPTPLVTHCQQGDKAATLHEQLLATVAVLAEGERIAQMMDQFGRYHSFIILVKNQVK